MPACLQTKLRNVILSLCLKLVLYLIRGQRCCLCSDLINISKLGRQDNLELTGLVSTTKPAFSKTMLEKSKQISSLRNLKSIKLKVIHVVSDPRTELMHVYGFYCGARLQISTSRNAQVAVGIAAHFLKYFCRFQNVAPMSK